MSTNTNTNNGRRPTLTPTPVTRPPQQFRELDSREHTACESLRAKSITPFRGIASTYLRVHYRWQRDGFCACVVQCRLPALRRDGKVIEPAKCLVWVGMSKRAPADAHNEIRGKMFAFVRAAQSTPAEW